MIKYKLNGIDHNCEWNTLVYDISQNIDNEVVYVFESNQEIHVDRKIKFVGSNVTLDFNNCNLITESEIVVYNEGYIKNVNVTCDTGNIDYNENQENIFGFLCCTNENDINNVSFTMGGNLEYNVTSDAHSIFGLLVGVNKGKLSKVDMKLDEVVVNVQNNCTCNYGTLVGKNNNGMIENITIDNVILKCTKALNCFSGGITSNCIHGTIKNVHINNIDVYIENIQHGGFAGIVQISSESIIEYCDIKCIKASVSNVKNDTYMGGLFGLCGINNKIFKCNIEILKELYNHNIKNLNIGGLIGYVDYSSNVENCYIKNIECINISNCKDVNCGGAIGMNNGSSVDIKMEQLMNIKTIDVTVNNIGGIVGKNYGYLEYCNLSHCKELYIDNGGFSNNIGGFCGYNESALRYLKINTLENIYSCGGKTNNAGGLVGHNNGMLEKCTVLNLGSVYSCNGIENICGGICGENTSNTVDNTIYYNEYIQPFGTDSIININTNVFNAISSENYKFDSDDISKETVLLGATTMNKSFENKSFNIDINDWNTSSITSMISTFKKSSFNQPLNDWDTTNVTSMANLFEESIFDKDISSWNLSSLMSIDDIFTNGNMSALNISNFVTSLYNYIMLTKRNDITSFGTLNISAAIEENMKNTYGYYSLYMLKTEYSLRTNALNSVDITHNVTGLDTIHVDISSSDTFDNGFIVEFLTDVDTIFSGTKSGSVYLKLNGNYDYRFKLKGGASDKGHDLYFYYNKKQYRYLSHGGINADVDISNYRIYSTKEGAVIGHTFGTTTNTDTGIITLSSSTPDHFYIKLDSLNRNNNYRAQFLPWDYGYSTVQNEKLGVISVPTLTFEKQLGLTGVHILQWGANVWMTMESMFENVDHVTIAPYSGTPNLKHCISMKNMFKGTKTFNSDIEHWNTSSVEDMSFMFEECENFNRSLQKWNVSKVKTMKSMFNNAKNFNQYIGSWEISKVTDFSSMFNNAILFNNELNSWNVHHTVNTTGMLTGTVALESAFIGSWDSVDTNNNDTKHALFLKKNIGSAIYPKSNGDIVIKCTKGNVNVSEGEHSRGNFSHSGTLGSTLSGSGSGTLTLSVDGGDTMHVPSLSITSTTTQDEVIIESWKYEYMVSYKELFKNITVTLPNYYGNSEFYNCPLCTTFESMFEGSMIINPEQLQYFNTTSVINMKNMFKNCKNTINIGSYISSWDVSNVNEFSGMFEDFTYFNGDLSSWNTRCAKNFNTMFKNATNFNKYIGNWNTCQVKSCNSMFENCTALDQAFYWDISKVRNMDKMFKKVQLSALNVDETLKEWSKYIGYYTPNLDIGDSEYIIGGNVEIPEYTQKVINDLENAGWNISLKVDKNVVNAIGDPYITPLYGNTYKIPDTELCYRLYDSSNVSINGIVQKFTDINALNSLVANLNKTKFNNSLDTKHLVFKDMYFFTKIVFKISNEACLYNLETECWETHKNENIKEISYVKDFKNLNEFYKKEKINVKTLLINDLKLKLYKCENPQIHTGLELTNVEKNSKGLLVYECISSSAVTKDLYDFSNKEIIKASSKDGTWIKEQFFTSDGTKLVKNIKIL